MSNFADAMFDQWLQQEEPSDMYDRNEFIPVSGRIIRETQKAYLLLDQDLEEIWIPKSVSQEDGAGGLAVQSWFIEREGLG